MTSPVSGRHASMEDVARHPSPIVGRESELAELLALADAAAHGEAGAVVLSGDAGVGKSRLVGELAERLTRAGTRCLIGRCVNLPDGGLPYLPFVDAFRPLDTESWHWLEPHLRGGADSSMGQLQLYEAVVELLFELAEQQPLCLVVEDVHWADRPSKDLLRYLLGRMERQRLTLVLTYRSDDLHRRHPLRPFLAEVARLPLVQRLALEALPADAIAALVRAGGAPGEAELADIVARAEGNPFFAEELREAGRSAPGTETALPDALLDVLVARLEQLDRGAAQVVGVAAVAGRRVGHELLAAVTGLPDAALDEALREAVAHHVLVPDGATDTYEFRHALLQEAAYADLLPGERVRLHREYALVLAEQLPGNPVVAAELSHHAEASHDLRAALSAAVLAATHALKVRAPGDAQRHLERALAWWGSVPDAEEVAGSPEWDLYLRAAGAASAAGDAARAATLLQAADQRLAATIGPEPNPEELQHQVTVRARLASARYYAGDERSERTADEAVALAERLPVCAARAEARSTGAVLLFMHGREGTERMARLALADAEAAGAVNLQAEALVTLARHAERLGDPDTATAHFTRAMELASASGDVAAELRTLFNLAMNRYDAGDLPGTLRWTGRSIDRAAATGMTYSEYARESRGIDVIARYVSGDWDAGLDPLWDAEQIPVTARTLLDAFSLHIAVGRGLPDVRERVDRLRAAKHPDPDVTAQLTALVGGCEVDHLTWGGDPARAVEVLRATIDAVEPAWGAHFLGRIWLDALGLAALGDLAAQARLREDAAGAATAVERGEAMVADARDTARLGRPRGERLGAEGVAWLARAEAEWSRVRGERDDAVWRQALAAFDYGYTYEVARCRWRLAGVLLERAAGGGRPGGDGSDRGRDDRGGARAHADAGDGAGVNGGAGDAARANGGARANGDAGDGAGVNGGDGARRRREVGGGAGVNGGDEAATLLRSAYADARRLGAAPLADAVTALARRAKIAGVGAPTSVSLLTPREQEVLELLARGRTNRQLGKELFISEKTASVHVSNILAKLDAGTRGEAVALARRRGLI
jgi:DNA-binding CsgD family transcriptional regulator/tetratricopeptide (TPR) repeat protein